MMVYIGSCHLEISMDTSPEYIKMCDCKEVQKQYKRQEGDVLYYRNGKSSHRHRLGEPDHLVNKSAWIFLPRQDQIQEMIYRLVCDYRVLQDFATWCMAQRHKDMKLIKDRTLEQLWLMFFMWRTHYKLWDYNNQGWIDE